MPDRPRPCGATPVDLTGHTVVVTGGNSGIGLETCVSLATMGADVVMAARDRKRADVAAAEVRARSGREVEVMHLDLASLDAVRAFADAFLASHERLDVLVNNAGVALLHRSTDADGFESTFGVNHLGHFLLTVLLLERLQESAPSRVVVVASGAHSYARRGLDFDDLQAERRWNGMAVYARSKLANILFTRELARRLAGTGVTANALHPGFVATNLGRDGDGGWLGELATRVLRPVALTPERGARTTVHLASSPELEGVTGGYFVKCRPARPSRAALDDDAARRLWQVSEELVAR